MILNYGETESPMLHNKFLKLKIFKVFTIYGHGSQKASHFGHVIVTSLFNS